MQTPVNPFKQALREQRTQIGLWLGLGGCTATEICAGAGFDWLLIDGEHAPLGVADVQAQAQVIAGYPTTHAIARVPVADAALIKQYLDTGVQTLLVPMVNSAQQAALCVSACRYPQDSDQGGQGGMRGMAGARASRWGRVADYARAANAKARRYLALGAVFVAVGLDTQILARQTSALAQRFGGGGGDGGSAPPSVY